MRDDEKTKLHENLKQEIRSLLISSPKTKYGGLTGSLLYFDYQQLNCGKQIPYAELGFHSFLALLRSMPDVVQIEFKANSQSYRVHPVYDQSTAHIQKMVLEQRDKYQLQNRLHIQNWRFPFEINEENSWFKVAHNHVNPHSFDHSIHRRRMEKNCEPYLLLKPPDYPKQDQRRDFLFDLSSKSFDQNETSSSLNTFFETSSDETHEKEIIDINQQIIDHSDSPVQKQVESNENIDWIKRIQQAIRQCIEFRYIHRLYEIEFEYRHYPLSDEIISIKSNFSRKASDEHEQELIELEQCHTIIADEKCQMMFDQYISLQRNYYFMNRIMKKKKHSSL